MKDKLDSLLNAITQFLMDNGLLVNRSKTELICLSTHQQLTANPSPDISLDVLDIDDKQIAPSKSARLLGMNVSRDMSWVPHMIMGPEAILPLCKSKLGALYKIGKFYPQVIRLKLVNALIMSRILYGIQICMMLV